MTDEIQDPFRTAKKGRAATLPNEVKVDKMKQVPDGSKKGNFSIALHGRAIGRDSRPRRVGFRW